MITRILESVLGGERCHSMWIVDTSEEIPADADMAKHDRVIVLDTQAMIVFDGARLVPIGTAPLVPPKDEKPA